MSGLVRPRLRPWTWPWRPRQRPRGPATSRPPDPGFQLIRSITDRSYPNTRRLCALRLSRHRSRGLTTGYAIRCHPSYSAALLSTSTSCCGTYDSVLVGPRLQAPSSKTWLTVATGGIGDSFILLPRILWCWVSFARAFLLGRLVLVHY